MKRYALLATILIAMAVLANAEPGITSTTTKLAPNVSLTWVTIGGPKTGDAKVTTRTVGKGEFILRQYATPTRVEVEGKIWVVNDGSRWNSRDLSGCVLDEREDRIYISQRLLDNDPERYLTLQRWNWGKEEQMKLPLEQYKALQGKHFIYIHEVSRDPRPEVLRYYDVPWTGIGADEHPETSYTQLMPVPEVVPASDWEDLCLDDGRMANHTSVILEVRYVDVNGNLGVEQLDGSISFLPKGSKKMGEKPTLTFASPQGPKRRIERLEKIVEGDYYITIDGHVALVSHGTISFVP